MSSHTTSTATEACRDCRGEGTYEMTVHAGDTSHSEVRYCRCDAGREMAEAQQAELDAMARREGWA